MPKGRTYESESGTLTIIGNGHERELVAFWDLPANARAEFDYMLTGSNVGEQSSPRFVSYLGNWHDVNEFETTGYYYRFSFPVIQDWHGIQSDSFFSGLLVRYTDEECGYVTVARYFTS